LTNERVAGLDKDQTVADLDTMNHIVAEAVAQQRFSMVLFGVFAALALPQEHYSRLQYRLENHSGSRASRSNLAL
jgi:hypothetical protein